MIHLQHLKILIVHRPHPLRDASQSAYIRKTMIKNNREMIKNEY